MTDLAPHLDAAQKTEAMQVAKEANNETAGANALAGLAPQLDAEQEERERQFLMSVSHELRTSLTAIKGHVDAIRDGLFDDRELTLLRQIIAARQAGEPLREIRARFQR